jgi:hypothetical protein
VHVAEIGDLGHAAEFFRRYFPHRREYRYHRVIDPHIDTAASLRNGVSRDKHSGRIGDIDRENHGVAAEFADFAFNLLKRVLVARDEPDGPAARAKRCAIARPTPADAPVTTTVD